MAILSAMLNSLGCYYPHLATNDHQRDLANFEETSAIIISKVRTMAAYAYRASVGLPYIYPRRDLRTARNFLHMMFSTRSSRSSRCRRSPRPSISSCCSTPTTSKNCSTSTVAHGRVQRSEPVCLDLPPVSAPSGVRFTAVPTWR